MKKGLKKHSTIVSGFRIIIPFLGTLLISIPVLAQQNRWHQKAILADTHNDVLSSQVIEGRDISVYQPAAQSDLVRWKKGGLDIQFFSVWTDRTPRHTEGPYADANEEIDSLIHFTERNAASVRLCTTYASVLKTVKEKKIAALIGVEGGHMIESKMENLEALAARGMRYLTLTWNNSTPWASSAMDETLHADSLAHKGLSEQGRAIVKRMNELGVIVDLSHTGEQTFYDAIATSSKPVLLSHSSVWSICPVFRNLKDDQIRAVAKNGGVICVNFYSGFISKKYDERSAWLNGPGKKQITDSLMNLYHDTAQVRKIWEPWFEAELQKVKPSVSDLVDHIDYIVKLVGDNYAGIGSDFDGVSSLPVGMEDASSYPKITEELIRRGYSGKSIRKILGGNVLRVMKANFAE